MDATNYKGAKRDAENRFLKMRLREDKINGVFS